MTHAIWMLAVLAYAHPELLVTTDWLASCTFEVITTCACISARWRTGADRRSVRCNDGQPVAIEYFHHDSVTFLPRRARVSFGRMKSLSQKTKYADVRAGPPGRDEVESHNELEHHDRRLPQR